MTNHHKLLFLQNSDIPNHLSADAREGAQITPSSCLKAVRTIQTRKIALPFEPFYESVGDLINAVKHLRISLAIEISTDCPSLVSQSLLTDFP